MLDGGPGAPGKFTCDGTYWDFGSGLYTQSDSEGGSGRRCGPHVTDTVATCLLFVRVLCETPAARRFGLSCQNRERNCADTIGTVLIPWAGHFQ